MKKLRFRSDWVPVKVSDPIMEMLLERLGLKVYRHIYDEPGREEILSEADFKNGEFEIARIEKLRRQAKDSIK